MLISAKGQCELLLHDLYPHVLFLGKSLACEHNLPMASNHFEVPCVLPQPKFVGDLNNSMDSFFDGCISHIMSYHVHVIYNIAFSCLT